MSKIVSIRRVAAYATTDDKHHRTAEEAKRHQAVLDLAALLAPEVAPDQHAPVSAEAVAEFLLQNAEKVTALLRPAMPKPQRKAAAPAPALATPKPTDAAA